MITCFISYIEKKIILAAVGRYGYALRFASENLKADKDVVLVAVQQHGRALEYASENLKADKKVVTDAVEQNGSALEYVSEDLKADRDFVIDAVKQNGGALFYASENFKADKDVVLAAVKQYGGALLLASENLRADREVVLAAVKQDGYLLFYASENLKADKDVVLPAVKQYGGALFCASENLRADKDVVLAAVKQDGRALQFASEELLNNSPGFKNFLEKVRDKKFNEIKILPPKNSKYLVFRDPEPAKCVLLKYREKATTGATEDIKGLEILDQDVLIALDQNIFSVMIKYLLSFQDIFSLQNTNKESNYKFNNIFEKGYYASKNLGFNLIPKGIEAGKEKFFDHPKVEGDEDNGYHILLGEKIPHTEEGLSVSSNDFNVELAGEA